MIYTEKMFEREVQRRLEAEYKERHLELRLRELEKRIADVDNKLENELIAIRQNAIIMHDFSNEVPK